MITNRPLRWAFLLLIFICAIYRIIPDRPFGFAPQWAMAVFAGAIVPNKKWAFLMPVLSMFLSDLLIELFYLNGWFSMPGIYMGQWQNYFLFGLLAFLGFGLRRPRIFNIILAALVAPTIYFVLSNCIVWSGWQGTRGYERPKTLNGLMLTLADGLPFYRVSIVATLIFSSIFFGVYAFITKSTEQNKMRSWRVPFGNNKCQSEHTNA